MVTSSASISSRQARSRRAAAALGLVLAGGTACWRAAPPPPALELANAPPAPAPARRATAAAAGCVAVVADVGASPLRGATCLPGEPIEIRFGAPVDSTAAQRAWVTVAPASSPPSAYNEWAYVDDGAEQARLTAPTQPGDYEVRLHADYPAQQYNVVGSVRIVVAARVAAGATPAAQQRFALGAATLAPGATIDLRFPAAMRAAPGEQFWVTVVADGAPDSDWSAWAFVAEGARAAMLPAPDQPGSYEVRLHANYPTQLTNVVHRAALAVH